MEGSKKPSLIAQIIAAIPPKDIAQIILLVIGGVFAFAKISNVQEHTDDLEQIVEVRTDIVDSLTQVVERVERNQKRMAKELKALRLARGEPGKAVAYRTVVRNVRPHNASAFERLMAWMRNR